MKRALKAIATPDRALWIADGSALWRLAREGDRPASYEAAIAPFFDANCSRCHTPPGTAHSFGSYEAWVRDIDKIIDAVKTGRPADQRPLINGDTALLERWRDAGFPR
jgi:hypothetical protein